MSNRFMPWLDLYGAAERRGFVVEPGRPGALLDRGTARGEIDGRRISLEVGLVSGKEGLIVRGWLDPPLDLGLEMHARAVAALFEPEPVTGSPDLDGEFTTTGDEPARVHAFFDQALRDALLSLYRASFDLRIHDAGCSIFMNAIYDADEAWLERAFDAAARLVGLMDASRAHLAPARRLAGHAEALRTLASARRLAFRTTPLTLAGDVDGRAIEVGATRTGREKYHLTARAAFETELGIGLAVRRQGLLDGLRTLLGGQDVLVGDAPFDARFLIRAEPARADRVAMLLDAPVRAALLEIASRCGDVALDDRGVTVDPIAAAVEPADLVWLVDTLVEVTRRIGQNLVHGGAEAGPYR